MAKSKHVELNYWTQLICGHHRLSLVNYMIMHKNDVLDALLWNNDDLKKKIALSFESKRKRTILSHKANDSNEIELVLFLQRTTVKCPRKNLVTARYFPDKCPSKLTGPKITGTFEKRAPGLKTGAEKYIIWFEIGSGFGESGGTLRPRIPRSTPPPPPGGLSTEKKDWGPAITTLSWKG